MAAFECCREWLWKHEAWVVLAVIHFSGNSLCFSGICWATGIQVNRRRRRKQGWRLRSRSAGSQAGDRREGHYGALVAWRRLGQGGGNLPSPTVLLPRWAQAGCLELQACLSLFCLEKCTQNLGWMGHLVEDGNAGTCMSLKLHV